MSQRERPILFSSEMVRAILEGRKTQTRRIAKVHDSHIPGQISPNGSNCARSPQEHIAYCPYGKVGDRLWVRETWRNNLGNYGHQTIYRADYPEYAVREMKQLGQHWKPSIFMPRWASRITMEITNVRVERVQAIGEADAIAEGVTAVIRKKIHGWTPHVLEYNLLWDKLNAKRGFGWDVNPWVWVIEFKRVEGDRSQGGSRDAQS